MQTSTLRFWEKYGRRATPYFFTALLWPLLNLDDAGFERFWTAGFILGSVGVFWEISNPKPSSAKDRLLDLIMSAWFGGPMAAMLWGASLLLGGGLLYMMVAGVIQFLK